MHACGVIIAPDDLVKFLPLEVSAKGPIAAQFPMGQVEELGLLKMDFLGLSNLSVINNALRMIRKVYHDDIDLSSVKMCISGGERLEKQASEDIINYFDAHGAKVKICNGYGVGECLGSITVAVGATYHPDTVGRVVPGCHVMVLDPETGEELGFGQTGIIYATGKHVLARYFNRPELDEEKIKNIGRRDFGRTCNILY